MAALLFVGAVVFVAVGLDEYSRPVRERHLENQPSYYHEVGGAILVLGAFLALTGMLAVAALLGWLRRIAWRGLGLLSLVVALALAHWPPFAFVRLVLGVGCLWAGQGVR
jgi:hypothetical protein